MAYKRKTTALIRTSPSKKFFDRFTIGVCVLGSLIVLIGFLLLATGSV